MFPAKWLGECKEYKNVTFKQVVITFSYVVHLHNIPGIPTKCILQWQDNGYEILLAITFVFILPFPYHHSLFIGFHIFRRLSSENIFSDKKGCKVTLSKWLSLLSCKYRYLHFRIGSWRIFLPIIDRKGLIYEMLRENILLKRNKIVNWS